MSAREWWPATRGGARPVQLGTACVALCLCAAAPLVARAEDGRGETGDVPALQQEVRDLKDVVQRLGERVEGLEKQLQPPSQPAPQAAAAPAPPVPQPSAPVTPGDSAREHWRQVSHGMSAQEVETLLGHPQRTMKVNLRTVWYYTYPEVGSGSIVFASDGGVEDWQTPPFRTWWW